MNKDFADYCCELMQSAGPCVPKRMFGGWGISVDGLTIAIIADLGGGEKLWLKASDETRAKFEAAGGARFTYEMTKNGVSSPRGMNYYSAPEEAMDSPDAMRPWARLALDCAISAKLAKPKSTSKPKAKPKVEPAAKAKPAPARKAAKAPRSGG
jgi:DNA transformation protein and related proteins